MVVRVRGAESASTYTSLEILILFELKVNDKAIFKFSVSIDYGRCEGSSREPNRTIASVVDRIQPLEDRLADYEIESLTARATDIINNEIDLVSRSSKKSVESSRPDLSVGCQLEIDLAFIK